MRKILFFDIESTPLITYTWGIYEQNVAKVLQDWYLLCVSHKWGHEKTTYVTRLTKGRKSEKELVKKVWDLFNEADVIVGHNLKRFDKRKMNAKFLEHGLLPPSPYDVIDTLTIARSAFALTSNKLDDLGELLGLGKKVKHPGIDMWHGCMNDDEAMWKLMVKYSKQDTVLLERVYEALKIWNPRPPKFYAQYKGEFCCPLCGESKYQHRGTEERLSCVVERLQCKCGKWFYGAKTPRDVRDPEEPTPDTRGAIGFRTV